MILRQSWAEISYREYSGKFEVKLPEVKAGKVWEKIHQASRENEKEILSRVGTIYWSLAGGSGEKSVSFEFTSIEFINIVQFLIGLKEEMRERGSLWIKSDFYFRKSKRNYKFMIYLQTRKSRLSSWFVHFIVKSLSSYPINKLKFC